MPDTSETIEARCCIAGGGPAGMVLGLLLARAGIDVLVLEKHRDFLRDFRGDTIHPSTLEVMHELGLLDRLLALPHQRAPTLAAQFGDLSLTFVDFSRLPTRCRFIAFMPQWDFLDFLAREAARFPAFRLMMATEATGLIEEGGRIAGLEALAQGRKLRVRADLVVGADGRHSLIRARSGLEVEEFGAPMDVLWFPLARRAEDPQSTMGRFDAGRAFIMINRGESWQCGFVIPKGTIAAIRARGLDAFRAEVARLSGLGPARVATLRDWDAVSLLTVRVDRLRRWHRPALLCIGDAAHAMSPVAGVGINLAIQDAVAAANLLAAPLREGRLSENDLARVQRRREWPTRVTQRLQIGIQNRVIRPVLGSKGKLAPPVPLRLIARLPVLRRLLGRLVGMGIRPEHVRSPGSV